MRILVLSTSSNNTAAFTGSLECLGEHDVQVIYYDQKYNQAVNVILQRDPQAAEMYKQYGRLPHVGLDDASMDKEMLLAAQIGEPDMIVYISAWTGAFVPLNETLIELNGIAPLVHFLCDAADPPWWPKLEVFERRKCFSLTVAVDGNHYWPGGKDWDQAGFELTGYMKGSQGSVVKNAITLLTPVDLRHFGPPNRSYGERPYAIGYGGSTGTHERNEITRRLQAIRGYAPRPRDTNPASYPAYADFLKNCRVSVSVPFTGSGKAAHVKGRVLESGFAGACLLEWKNASTASWFTPREMYWEYESVEECAEAAEWLASKPKLGEQIARALNNEVMKNHSPKKFWDTVIERVGK